MRRRRTTRTRDRELLIALRRDRNPIRPDAYIWSIDRATDAATGEEIPIYVNFQGNSEEEIRERILAYYPRARFAGDALSVAVREAHATAMADPSEENVRRLQAARKRLWEAELARAGNRD